MTPSIHSVGVGFTSAGFVLLRTVVDCTSSIRMCRFPMDRRQCEFSTLL